MPPKGEAERYYLLTLNLAEAIKCEWWEDVAALFAERSRLLTELEANNVRFTGAEVAKIQAVEAKTLEMLKSMSGGISAAIRSNFASGAANRAYAKAGRSGQIGFSQVG